MIAAGRAGHRAPIAPAALAARLGRPPPAPGEVAAAIGVYPDQLAFERLVRDLWPGDGAARAILDARDPGERRETARVRAFVERFSACHFPLQPCEEYGEVVGEVPFERLGFAYDEVEGYDGRLGYLLLLIAVMGDAMPGLTAHAEALHRDAGVTLGTLGLVPAGQREPDRLAALLVGTPYAAATDLARWLYGETGSCFLDLTWDVQVLDNAGWTPAFVAALTAQWRETAPLIARVDALATLLEADPDTQFAALLRAIGSRAHPEGAAGDARIRVDGARAAPDDPRDAAPPEPPVAIGGGNDGMSGTAPPGRLIPVAARGHVAASA